MFPKNTNNAMGRFSGDKKKLINKMFKVTGKMIRLARVTYRPEINDNPQRNSKDLAKGIKYVDAIKPTLNALKFPVDSGSGDRCKKKLIEV
jgi:hypothetical protein